ncbi:MAG TPA: ABC transporter substrate-binding protein [Candidatus Dormibacteraeota bacterium]|jgi:branched-chain amino acid transport system substrate-binding protein
MIRWRYRLRGLAAATAGLLVGLACGTTQGSQAGTTTQEVGVTDTSVTIGATTPLSGPASFYAPVSKGANAYYQYINAQGGVNGRQIKYVVYDDGYDPAKAVPLVHQLVEQDQVFAVVGELGTPINTATEPYLNQRKVPDIFVATGASKWGAQYKQFPWTIGLQSDYVSEAKVYAKDIVKNHANAKIGILYQNDDFGKDYINGLTQGLGSNSGWITGTASYDATAAPDVSSQVAALKDKGTDLVLIAATPAFAISAMKSIAKLNWKPNIYLDNVATSTVNTNAVIAAGAGQAIEGMTSSVTAKDPNDARWADDPVMALYRKVLAQYCTPQPCNPTDATYFAGMAGAWVLVDVLKKMGKNNVTRTALMQQVRNMNISDDPFNLPGITLRTGGSNQYPTTQLALEHFQSGHWVIDYTIINAR